MRSLIPRLTKPMSSYDFLTKWLPEEVFLPEPRRLRMQWWHADATNGLGGLYGLLASTPNMIPECGTVGCIGGWTELVLTGSARLEEVKVREALGLTYEMADELFYDHAMCSLPNQGTRGHTLAVIRHIKDFARRHETELKAHIINPADYA